MKYVTKKWYEVKVKTNLHESWVEDEKAAEFSEELFETLYKEKEAIYINDYISKPENNVNLTTDTVYRRAKRFFREYFFNQSATLQKLLPIRVLNRVADIRILALDHATSEVIGLTKEFCAQNEETVQKALDDYNELLVRDFGSEEAARYTKELDLKDYTITSVRRQPDSSLTIDLEDPTGARKKRRITLAGSHLIKKDLGILNSSWYFAEIYKVPKGIELHVLTSRNGLRELIVSGSEISFRDVD